MLKIGTVTRFYDKIGVAVVELISGLAVGDTIKFVLEGEDLFEQKVDSIQIGHDKVDFAGPGSIVGLKPQESVVESSEVYKI